MLGFFEIKQHISERVQIQLKEVQGFLLLLFLLEMGFYEMLIACSGGMSGYIYISDKTILSSETYSPVEGMKTIAKNRTMYVFVVSSLSEIQTCLAKRIQTHTPTKGKKKKKNWKKEKENRLATNILTKL